METKKRFADLLRDQVEAKKQNLTPEATQV
jgi:hypothetical protein